MLKEGKPQKQPRKPRGILWKVLFVILAIIFFAVLELGKHTILGWVWAVLVLALFFCFRSTRLKEAKRGVRLLSWLCLLVLCAVVLWVSWPPMKRVPAVDVKNPEKTEVVHIAQGDLTGVVTEDGEVEIYAGIPYAKPPVGELRWKEPEPAGGWEGVFAADTYAPMSMQTRNLPIYDSLAQIIGYHDYEISLKDNYREAVSEDSLYLNIWKPSEEPAENLPVLVFIHGGSLQTGNSWYKDHKGEGLARDGVIVVEMGYRLGIFGFFADPELAAESQNGTTGNYGLQDQILALHWVQDNISAFGGDPENVTLSGESAGSACVSALCTAPPAKGLFRRVLAESSTVASPEPSHSFRLLEEAFEAAAETKAKYGVSSAAELRKLPAEKIVEELEVHHHMTVDGYVLPETPCESYKKGIYNEEAQMHGFNLEESAPFLLFEPTNLKNYEKKVRDAFDEPYAERILSLFPASTDEEAAANWESIYSVYFFHYGHFCLSRLAGLNGIPSYMYHFTKDNGRLGTWHSGEEVYFYGNIPPSSSLYTEEDRNLSEQMRRYLINYMKTGNPNGEELPLWEETDSSTVQELGAEIRETETPFQELYAIFDDMYGFELE